MLANFTYVLISHSATIELLDFSRMEFLTGNGPEISVIDRDIASDNYLVCIASYRY